MNHRELVKSFSTEEVDQVLRELIAHDNDIKETAQHLQRAGWPAIYPETVRQLAKLDHPDRYQQLLREDTISDTAEAANVGAKTTALGLRQLLRQIEDGTVKDLPKAIDSASQAMARATEKNQTLQGQPDRIVQSQSFADVVRGLNSIQGISVTLPESSVTELTDETDG